MSQIKPSSEPGLGTGIYTISEAAHLLQVSKRKVVGWAERYVHSREGPVRVSPPVLDREGAEPGLLTFHDLIELVFVREFRKAGVDLPQIRAAAALLREEWNTPYPFATQKVVDLERKLVNREDMKTIIGRQQVFEFGRKFFNDVDFDRFGLAEKWHPLGKGKLIILDPHRSFGAPIELRSGIRTDVLYRQYLAEGGDVQAVADWYEVPTEAVKQAVEFEEKWQAAA